MKKLETQVWTAGRCSGCGMCVAACSKQVLRWNGKDHPYLETRLKSLGLTRQELDTCSFCDKLCELSCPRLEAPALRHDASPLGVNILAVRALGPVRSGAPNDVIRAILAAGRSAGLLDGVITLDLDAWQLKPLTRIAYTVEEIVDSLGPQYLWAPVLDALNEAVYQRGMQNIAVVGPPCVAEAIARMRQTDNPRLRPYREAIRLSVAFFCTGIYRPEMIDELLVRQMGVTADQVRRLEVSADREHLRAVLWDGTSRTITRQAAEAYTRPGCSHCDDFIGQDADVGIGAVGASEGFSTLVVHTLTGEVFTRNAIAMRLLETTHTVNQEAVLYAVQEKERRRRTEALEELRILALDALADPHQRGEAIQQFIRLYRTPIRSKADEQARNLGCGGCD